MTPRPVQHGGGVELDNIQVVDPKRRQCFALELTAEVAFGASTPQSLAAG